MHPRGRKKRHRTLGFRLKGSKCKNEGVLPVVQRSLSMRINTCDSTMTFVFDFFKFIFLYESQNVLVNVLVGLVSLVRHFCLCSQDRTQQQDQMAAIFLCWNRVLTRKIGCFGQGTWLTSQCPVNGLVQGKCVCVEKEPNQNKTVSQDSGFNRQRFLFYLFGLGSVLRSL